MSNNLFPFYTPPVAVEETIGTKESGQVVLPKYNDITVFEKTYVEEALDNRPTAVVLMTELVNLLVQEEALSVAQATEVVMGGNNEIEEKEALEIRKRYSQELMKLNEDLAEYAQARKIACAEALIMGRLVKNDPDSVRDFVSGLSVTLLDAINTFWLKEVNNGKIEEETEGK